MDKFPSSVRTSYVRLTLFFSLLGTLKPDEVLQFHTEDGSKLPNARAVSSAIHGHVSEDLQAANMSLLVMQFGQFLDHDITLTAEAEMCNKCGTEPVLCCDYYLEKKNYTIQEMPKNCWPIPIPVNDSIFHQNGPKCLEFKRSNRVACRAEHDLTQ